MTIKQKLYSLGVVAILGIVALLFSTTHFVSKSEQLQQAIKLVADLEIRLLNLRRNEKDFYSAVMLSTCLPLIKTLIFFFQRKNSSPPFSLATNCHQALSCDKIYLPTKKSFKPWSRPIKLWG